MIGGGVTTWNGDGMGVERASWGTQHVFDPPTTIKQSLEIVCLQAAKHAYELRRDIGVPINLRAVSAPLAYMRNAAGKHPDTSGVPALVFKYANAIIKEAIQEIDQKGPAKDSDFDKLVVVSAVRDFHSECAVCLESGGKMGVTCSCGQTEIAIFCPCMHAVCVHCYEGMAAQANIELKDEIKHTAYGDFRVVGKKKLETNGTLRCPLCRAVIERVFREENVALPQHIVEKIKLAASAIAVEANISFLSST